MAVSDTTLGWIFAIQLGLLRFGAGTLTPLFLDSINPSGAAMQNTSEGQVDPVYTLPSTPSWQRIDPLFFIVTSMGFDTFVMGLIVISIILCAPGRITERERDYPKLPLLFAGSCQAVSALLFEFSTSGSRTAPFLLGALGYFYVPIAFTTRFLILRKRPTRKKLICATVIVLAEFVSLLPTMFPTLENEAARRQEGGATGAGRILWPLVFVSNGIPHAIWNVLLERSVKEKKGNASEEESDPQRLNMAYIMFWNFLGTFSATILFFWVDFIPGFGLMPDVSNFGKQLLFNMKCMVGATPICGFYQLFTAWGRIVCKSAAFITAGLLLRYGEGANLYAIIAAMIQPMRFLFFTLFNEQPFEWHPHATLSTWLSIGALAVMFPAVIIYTKSPEPPDPTEMYPGVTSVDEFSEQSPLLQNENTGNRPTSYPAESDTQEHTGVDTPTSSVYPDDDVVPVVSHNKSYGCVNSEYC